MSPFRTAIAHVTLRLALAYRDGALLVGVGMANGDGGSPSASGTPHAVAVYVGFGSTGVQFARPQR